MPAKRTTKPRGLITLEDLLSKGYFLRGPSSLVMEKRRKKQAARGVWETGQVTGPDMASARPDLLDASGDYNRDPWPHPWATFLPDGWELVREKLETGDVVLSALPEGAVMERKTPSDMAGCIGANRERFERELKRGRYVGRMIVVIEGTLADGCAASRGISHNACAR